MKIKYKFITGEVTEIEVDENIGTVILDSRRLESNQDRKERYHCYSIEGAAYEGMDYASDETPESILLQNDYTAEMCAALETLTAVQKRRLAQYLNGMSMRDIARREGVSAMSVSESFEEKKKKLKHFI